MRGARFATVLFGLMLAIHVGQSDQALAQNELSFVARIGETVAYTATAPKMITGLRLVPPDATVRLLDERSRIEVDCAREGVVTVTLEIRDGSVVSTVTLRIECRGRSFELAPSPGGAADDPVRFNTGEETSVTQVDCKDPLSCNTANQGRQGGFIARCVGRGSGQGTYVYQYLETLPSGEVRMRMEIRTRGTLTARCPRD